MIYDYCCTNCGNRFSGEKIAFDLVELLDLDFNYSLKKAIGEPHSAIPMRVNPGVVNRDPRTDSQQPVHISASNALPDFMQKNDSKTGLHSGIPATGSGIKYDKSSIRREELKSTLPKEPNPLVINSKEPKEEVQEVYKAIHAFISPEELKEIAEASGVRLKDRQQVKISISLHQFFAHMTFGTGKKGLYTDLPYGDSVVEAFQNSLTVGENKSNVKTIAEQYWETIRDTFLINTDVNNALKGLDDEDKTEIIANTDNYETSFEIIPHFFEQDEDDSNRHLYTIQYVKEGKVTDIHGWMGIFRGYCTNQNCRKPVLRYTGKYPHRVVGMLGAMSAGKTSMITAMTVEIEKHNDLLGVIALTGDDKLYDDDVIYREQDYQLYKHGWAVGKTASETREGSYNASFLLTDKYSQTEKVILTLADIAGEKCYDPKRNAFDLGAFTTFPMIGHCDAYLVCACIDQNGYGNADGKTVPMPPSAITSIASGIYNKYYENNEETIPPLCIVMTKADMAKNNTVASGDDNPFNEIKPINKKQFLFNDGLSILRSIYNTTDNVNVCESLRLCVSAYEEMSMRTYTAILSAAAMGREAHKFPGDINSIGYDMEKSNDPPFSSRRLEDVWNWILKVCGVIPVYHDYKFPKVPSYLEYYSMDHSHVYNIDNCENRIAAIGYIGINQSNSDREMRRASMQVPGRVDKWKYGGEKKAIQHYIEAVMPQSLSESKDKNMRHRGN